MGLPDLNTVRGQPRHGSNPCLSAKMLELDMHISQRLEIINQLLAALNAASQSDQQKAVIIKSILASTEAKFSAELTTTDKVLILETLDGANGSKDSLLRVAIANDSPLAFEALYNFAGLDCISRHHRATYHSPRELEQLMQTRSIFCSRTPGSMGYGPGGQIRDEFHVLKLGETWHEYFASEALHDDRIPYIDARIAMFDSGVRVPIAIDGQQRVAYETQVLPDGTERLVCKDARSEDLKEADAANLGLRFDRW